MRKKEENKKKYERIKGLSFIWMFIIFLWGVLILVNFIKYYI